MLLGKEERCLALNIDKRDLKILEILQINGRITKVELAERINLSPAACWDRLKRLEQAGVISHYHAEIALDKILQFATFIVQIELENHRAQDFKCFENKIRNISAITQCYAVGGGIDYILIIVAPDIERYQRLIDQLLENNLGIKRYYTFIVTKAVKSSPAPIAELIQDSTE